MTAHDLAPGAGRSRGGGGGARAGAIRPGTAVIGGDGRATDPLRASIEHRPQTADDGGCWQKRDTLRLRLKGKRRERERNSPRPRFDLLAPRPQTGPPAISQDRHRQRQAVHRWRLERKERDAQEAALREQEAKEAAEAWAMRVRACRATLLHLKSQSANSKPAPQPWRPPPEALVRLERTLEAHAFLRQKFPEDTDMSSPDMSKIFATMVPPPEPLRTTVFRTPKEQTTEVSESSKVANNEENTDLYPPPKKRRQFKFREGGGDGTAWDRRFLEQAKSRTSVNDEWYISYQDSPELQDLMRKNIDKNALIVQVSSIDMYNNDVGKRFMK